MRKLIERIQSRRRLLASPVDIVTQCHEEMAVIADERRSR